MDFFIYTMYMRFNLYGMQVYQEEANLFKKILLLQNYSYLTYTITQKRKTKQKKGKKHSIYSIYSSR